jgi:hypothetical protein
MVDYTKKMQLRNKDPKKKKTGTRHKDGETFKGGKNTKGRPKIAKKNLKCFNRGGYVTCIDTSKGKHYHKNKKNTGAGTGGRCKGKQCPGK